ncbi:MULTISPECIES: hypothetical protein [Mycobacteroides]|uniref:Uncharacterized protein n=1 Tax=Mycobacteroides franklinii TaxID=948102 RepID=A0A4R5P8C1_9MYCO|nr:MULTISPECIES: hypothetical protein [Mycobacteroides]MBN7314090.1 hypothetical protein [Mycobacteroides abscessus subsp. abscessus]ORA58292.1 hypothetical protein BST24_21740 [Mycobacteroides franklinii]TDH19914.1 hypothetical protein EJ571_17980 [Mycobacteroides franklinii]
MTRERISAYLGYIPVAAALLCIVYYLVFTCAMLFSSDSGTLKDRGGAALALLWFTPFTLAGSWYLTIPVVLVLALGLMWVHAKLPGRLANWRPHGIWQSVLFYVPAAYGAMAALALAVLTLIAIPSTLASY